MAKYRIAWMPGDGVGNDVMEAARIVLDRMKLDAEYVPCDIGWEFWRKEGQRPSGSHREDPQGHHMRSLWCDHEQPQSEAKEELARN